MKSIVFIVLGILLDLSAWSQDSINNLNCLIKIDDDIVKNGISSGSVYLIDKYGKSTAQFSIDYEVGRIKLKSEDIAVLRKMNYSKALLCFNYNQICPNTKQYNYKIELNVDFLLQRYLIIEIFNLDKRRNRRNFAGKSGYVFDIEIPATKLSSVRKSRAKNICN